MSKETIEFTLKAVSDFKDIISNIDNIQKNLNKLELPEALKSKFTNLFKEIEGASNKASTALASGFSKQGDVSKFSSSMNTIITLMTRLHKGMEDIDPDILKDAFSKFDTTGLEEATKQLDELQTKLTEITQKMANDSSLQEALKKLAEIGKFKITKDKDGLLALLEAGNFEGAAQQVDKLDESYKRLIKEYEKASAAAKKYENISSDASKEDQEAAKAAADKAKNAEDRMKNFKAAADDIKNIFASLVKDSSVEGLSDQVSELADKVKNMSDDQVAELTKQWEQLTGVDLSNLIAQVRGYKGETEKAGDETVKLNKDIEQIKNRITHFFGLANAVNLFRRAVRSAYETVKDLDKVMTETAVVTSFDVGDMWEQLPEYTARANQLGVSIHDAYEAATLYYQQGLKTNEVMAVSNETLKMARIAGLDAAESTDRMTNALRGFNMAITETNAQNINDVYSNLAAKTASNVDEISTAMTKVASLANNANMSFENTAAFLSQIIETTRESAETAGTALKTVIARFSEVKSLYSEGELLGEIEGEEIDVNKVSKALRTAGINLNEYLTGMKGLDDIFMELSSKWDSLDQVQQRYIATMAAGSRQQSRFIALMQDYSRMTELVSEANNSAGASQGQFEKTLESLQTKLNQLKNAWDTFLMGIADNEVIKFLIDLLTDLISTINKVLSGLDGLPKSIASIAIAIGGFKVGKSLFNKFFANLGKTMLPGLVKVGEDGGEELQKGILKGFDFKKLSINIDNGFKSIFSKFRVEIPADQVLSFKDPNQANILKQSLTAQLKDLKIPDTDKVQLGDLINKGDMEALDKQCATLGVTMDKTAGEAKKFGFNIQDSTQNMKNMSAACSAMGVGLMLVTSLLEKAGVENKPLLNGLKAVSGVLMAMPLIFKVIEASGVAAGANIQAAFGWISIVLAAIVGIGVALATIAKQNSPTEKLKQAQEAAQAAADAANEAAEAYKNLGDSFDSLGDKYKKLEDLIEGTQEWREAVFEINQQVLELIKNYPLLSELVTNKNGVLKIDLNSAEVQEVMTDYFQKSVEASSTAAAMQIRAIEAQNKVRYNDYLNSIYTTDNGFFKTTDYIRKGYDNWAFTKNRGISQEQFETAAKNLASGKWTVEDFIKNSNFFTLDEFNKEELTSGINNIVDELRTLGKSLLESEKQINAYNAQMAVNALQLKGIEGENATYASNFLSSEYVQTINEQVAKVIESGKDSLETSVQYKDFWNKQYGGRVKRIGNDGKVIYYDEEGKRQVKAGLVARQEYAAAQATDKLADAAEKFTKVLEDAAPEIKNLFTDNEGNALTQQDISQLIGYDLFGQRTFHGGKDGNFGNGEEAYTQLESKVQNLYKSIYGDNADLTSESYKVFYKQIEEEIRIAERRWNKAAESITHVFDKVPHEIETMTTSQAESIGNVLSETMLVNGKESAQKMWDLISKVGGEQTSKLAEAFNFIDFNNIESIEDFEGVLEDLNLSSLATEDGFDDLKAMLLDVAKASQQVDLQKVKKAIEELSSIRAKFLKGEATRTWSKEEFESMQSYLSQDILKDFVEDEDGNYIYLGDRMDDLRKAIEDNTFALRGEEITSLENQANARDILKQGTANWGLNQWQYGTVEGIIDAQGLSLEARQQIFEQYLKQLQEQFTPEQLKTLGLGISKEINLQNIIDEGKFKEYWERFINLANNAALDAQIEQFKKDKAVADLADDTVADVLRAEDQDAALGQLKLRAYKAGMGDELFANYNTGNIGELASMVTAYQEAQNLGIDTAKLEEYAALLRDTNKNLEDNITLSTQVALANTKLNDGLREIVDSYKDWTELINEDGLITPTTQEETEAFNKLKDSVNKMLNVAVPLTDEFWRQKENLELLKEVAEGNIDALGNLQKAATKTFLETTLKVDYPGAVEEINNIIDLIDSVELPNLEAGVELTGQEKFIDSLNAMIAAANLSVTDIQKIFDSLGFTVEFETATQKTKSTVYDLIPNNKQGHGMVNAYEAVPYEIETVVSIPVPKIKHLTSNGSGGGGISKPTIQKAQSNKPSSSSGKSGSSGSSSKPSYWKNPYDELYNLNEKINESLRKRQALERQYQKLIKSDASTIGDIRKAYRDQISMMQQQINLQRQLAQGRLNQINNLANQYYTDSEGRRRTYASMGVTRYAHYNTETGEITIDWNALEAIANDAGRSEEGAAAEAYINALQELVSSYEETRDAIWEIEDAIEDLNKELVQSYLSFEDRVLDALVASYEREIDSLEKINDTINDATSKMLDSMREQIDAQRQERDNAKTEEEIARMEARLAYLRQDTSGANSLEIMQLEKELENARQNYEDSLIDQALDQMQKDADLAAEQRAQQIEVMRAQLQMAIENGELWDQVYDLLLGAWDENGHIRLDSRLYELLSAADGTAAMSEVGKLEWWTEYVQSLNSFVGDIQGVYAQYGDQLSDELLQILQAIGGIREDIVINTPTVPVGGGNTGGNTGGNNGGSGNTGGGNTGGGNTGGNTGGGNTGSNTPTKISEVTQTLRRGAYGPNVRLLTMALHDLGITDFNNRRITPGLEFDEQVEQGVINFQADPRQQWGGAITADGIVGGGTRKKFKRAGYKTGGLADFTGPAWLDGTRTHPELVLNARDTENFISLKNILAGLMTPEANNGVFGKNDTYIDIDINADIGSDYDVQQLADEVKRQIVRDANYRNVNTINFIR